MISVFMRDKKVLVYNYKRNNCVLDFEVTRMFRHKQSIDNNLVKHYYFDRNEGFCLVGQIQPRFIATFY